MLEAPLKPPLYQHCWFLPI